MRQHIIDFILISMIVIWASDLNAQDQDYDPRKWYIEAPEQNTDGSPLIDLESIRVFWSEEEGTYNVAQSYKIPVTEAGSVVEHNFDFDCGKTFYLVATARNEQGETSAYSNTESGSTEDCVEPSKVPRPPVILTFEEEGVQPVFTFPMQEFTGNDYEAESFSDQSYLAIRNGRWKISFVVPVPPSRREFLVSRDAKGTFAGHLSVWVGPDNKVEFRIQNPSADPDMIKVAGKFQPGEMQTAEVSFGEKGLKFLLNEEVIYENADWNYGLDGSSEPLVIGASIANSGVGMDSPRNNPIQQGARIGLEIYPTQ